MTRWMAMLAVAACGVLGSFGVASADDGAVGSWNLSVGEPPHTYPSWIKVEKKGGKLEGTFLGGAGSPGGCGEVKVDGDTMTFNAHGWKWEGEIDGDKLKGTATNDKGEKRPFEGRRSVAKPDLTGRWIMRAPDDELFETKVALEIEEFAGEYEGMLEGLDREVSDLMLDEDEFSFYIEPGFSSGESGRSVQVKVQGHRMVGDVINMDGTEAKITLEKEMEWGQPIKLFNGKNLDGWKPLGNKDNYHWTVKDGVMVNEGGGGAANIVSERKFKDFKAVVEFKVPEGGNSGVYLRGRYEIQVQDDHGKDPGNGSCGAIYGRNAPKVNACKKAGEWQTYEIEIIGRYVTVKHNGRTIHDHVFLEGITGGAIDSHEDKPGPIYLQGDHGAIAYRTIEITPVKGDPGEKGARSGS